MAIVAVNLFKLDFMQNLEEILEASIALDEKLLKMSDEDLAKIYECSEKKYLKRVRYDLQSRMHLCDQLLPCHIELDHGKVFETKTGQELKEEVESFNKMIVERLG